MAHAFYDFLKKNGLEKVLLALSLDGENKNTGVFKRKRNVNLFWGINNLSPHRVCLIFSFFNFD